MSRRFPVTAGRIYKYEPVGLDIWDARTDLQSGELVRVVNLPGCPRAGTMGHCHVERVNGPRLAGGCLVLCASLFPVSGRRAHKPDVYGRDPEGGPAEVRRVVAGIVFKGVRP
jgi:hypothetical protein